MWGGGVVDNWPTEIVGVATLHIFDEKDRFSTNSCDSHMGQTFRFFMHILLKNNTKGDFYKNARSKIKLDKKLKD